MSKLSPAAALAAEADAKWHAGSALVVCTDAINQPGVVLVAIRLPKASCVLAIPAKDYDGMFLVGLLGFEQAKPDPLAVAIEAKAKAKTNDRVRKS